MSFRPLGAALVLTCAFAAGSVATVAQQPSSSAAPLKGKTVLITGSTDGLGRALALRAGTAGAQVLVHGRNKERGDAVVAEITKAGGRARFYAADLGSLAQVRTLAAAVLKDTPRLDVLVNNAGVWVRDERQQTADGHELHFGVNYLSGFLLTNLLLPRLEQSAPSRIVNVASISQSPIDFSDVMLERPGAFGRGYGQSKLAQIMFTIDLATALRDKRVTVAAVHPASLMDTTMVRNVGAQARSSVDDGADAVMRLMAGSDVESGAFYNQLAIGRPNAQALDVEARAQLRALSVRLTGSGK